jgi:hypothetical protein
MMKIPDLSKIDIKDIDAVKVKEQLIQHKGVVAQVGLGLVSFVVAVAMFNQSQGDIARYKSQIAVLNAKTGAIDQYNKTQSDVKDFLNKVPDSVSEDKMINLVTDLAGKNGVQILTFTRTSVEKKNTLVTTSLRFSLAADSFSGMVKFMADIERGKDFMKIWSCEAEPQLNIKRPTKENGNTMITFHIDVASLKVEL